MVSAASTVEITSSGFSARNTMTPHCVQYRFDRLAHRKLPWVPLAEIAAHAQQHKHREPSALRQRQHVDAITGAARLHQQHTARAAKIGAGQQCHAFLLGRQRHRMDARIG
jgi:hypothetical protein